MNRGPVNQRIGAPSKPQIVATGGFGAFHRSIEVMAALAHLSSFGPAGRTILASSTSARMVRLPNPATVIVHEKGGPPEIPKADPNQMFSITYNPQCGLGLGTVAS